jgi:predicted nucleic acid-binding protein
MPFSALLDTCVLYPGYLRDTLLRVAETGLYRPLWSMGILDELRRNLIKKRIPADTVERLISAMQAAFDEAEVTGYEPLIDTMICHPKDRHVLAAAVRGDAGALVTFNLRDFPPRAIDPYAIELLSADEFLLDLLDLAPDLVICALERQASSYKREPRTFAGLLVALRRGGAPRFTDEIHRRLD